MRGRRTLLVEIGCEELPPKVVEEGGAFFTNELCDRLERERFLDEAPPPTAVLCTPRRIAAKIENVATHQPTERVARKGPPATAISASDPATQGFAKSCGVAVSQLEIRDGRLFCHTQTGGRSLAETLSELLGGAANAACVGARMRWGMGAHTFARPVRWLCVLHGEEVIDCALWGLKSGRITYGHRHHCPQALTLECADDYEEQLLNHYVIVDFSQRREKIEKAIQQGGGKPIVVGRHLSEAAATTEWPQVLTATFAPAFLALPCEVIQQTLVHALKVFPRHDEARQLLPQFTLVADVESKAPATILRGYERVVRARLDDARFFFEQDTKTSLEARRPMLERTLFHEGLGTLADKTTRVEQLAQSFAIRCGASPEQVRRAAQLCKCDLATDVVGEYPTLQGIMGGYYAAHDGEDKAVCDAIRDHYRPQGHADALPASPESRALALADKADTLAGFWSIGLSPSGSKDPYGLRRAANGILRILVRHAIDIDIDTLVNLASKEYKGDCKEDLRDYMREQLCSYDFVLSFPQHEDKTLNCIHAVAQGSDIKHLHPSDFFKRLDAVAAFIKDPAAASLIAANKRIGNILKDDFLLPDFDAAAMTEDAERALHQALEARRAPFNRQLDERDYAAAMKTLAELREPIDHFFDEVLVMSDNETECHNRLRLLTDIRCLFLKIADFSQLQPQLR